MDTAKKEQPPATLGDVLYARPAKTPVPEREWVALVHSIAAGNQRALHALYDRAHRLVFTLAVRITGSRETAEEVTLDVFHDLWRRACRYDPSNGTVLGWIMNQARSRSLDRLRFEQRKKRTDPAAVDSAAVDSAESEVCTPQDMLEAKESAGALQAAVAVLVPNEQRPIQAAFFLGLTHDEVAARLNVPLGTVKTRIRSGLQKLRKTLADEGKDA
jgi:RNA polymerase sigma-70 factor (ECF subfamily)